MAISREIRDLEQQKFADVNNVPAVRTINVGGLDAPLGANYMEVSYPDNMTEVFTYKSGGELGTVLKTVTVVYLDSSKKRIKSVGWQ